MECQSILVVDDNEDMRHMVVKVLEREGHSVREARDGRAALEALAEPKPPTLILLDLMMPRMNGWEFLESAQKDPRLAGHPHRIVTMSAVDESQNIEQRPKFEVDDSIQKPVSLKKLMSVVKKFCASASAQPGPELFP